MEKPQELNFSVEDIDRMGDLRIKGLIKLAMDRNADIVKQVYDNSEKENLEENFKSGIFSNLKLKIIESLAEEMGVANPSSKEAWDEVVEKYPIEKIQELTDELAEEELKKWNLKDHETSN